MCLAARVNDGLWKIGGFQPVSVACRYKGGEVRDAASRSDVSGGRGRISQQVGHPAEQHILHANCAGAREKDPRILVGDRRQVIAERRRVDAAAGNIGEVSSRGRMPTRSHHVVFQQLDRRVEGNALLGDWRAQQADPLVLGLLVGLEGLDLPQEPLRRGNDRLAKSLTSGRSRLQWTSRPFELADLAQQISGGGTVALHCGTRKLRCRLAWERWTLSHSSLVNVPSIGCLARSGSCFRRAIAARSSAAPSSVAVGGGTIAFAPAAGSLNPAGMAIVTSFFRNSFPINRKCSGKVIGKPSIDPL